MRQLFIVKFIVLLGVLFAVNVSAQDHDHSDHSGHDHSAHEDSSHGEDASRESSHEKHGEHDGHGHAICGEIVEHEFDVTETAMHHIGDANFYTIGPLHLPLPTILYVKDKGFDVFSSAKFDVPRMSHGDGHMAYNGFVSKGGRVHRIKDDNFPMGQVEISGFKTESVEVEGKEKNVHYACDGNSWKEIEAASTADFGLFGGGITSFFDFSLTKNVVSMMIIFAFLAFVFFRAASGYKKRDGKAPKGIQSFMEPFVIFIRDEVAVPFLGKKWEKYFSFLLAIFFFILGLNLFGQIPFLGGSNVTGNLAVTMVLAIIAFIVTNFSGNAHYWKHQLIAPGIPWFVKPILIPVEIMGMFIKPLTLMLRLFANITAGHIVLIVFVSLIFIFGNVGQNVGGALGASIGSTLLTLFMMAIELIVALVQAFVFTILTASYIGAAVEEEHH